MLRSNGFKMTLLIITFLIGLAAFTTEPLDEPVVRLAMFVWPVLIAGQTMSLFAPMWSEYKVAKARENAPVRDEEDAAQAHLGRAREQAAKAVALVVLGQDLVEVSTRNSSTEAGAYTVDCEWYHDGPGIHLVVATLAGLLGRQADQSDMKRFHTDHSTVLSAALTVALDTLQSPSEVLDEALVSAHEITVQNASAIASVATRLSAPGGATLQGYTVRDIVGRVKA